MHPKQTAPGHGIAVHELGEGIPVVLVHGLMGCRETWQGVAERLAAAGLRVLVPELLGFGQSERPPGIESIWLDAQARALQAALRPRLPHGAVFVGHDYGGPAIVTLYRQAPSLVRGLALVSCNLAADTAIPFPLSAWSWPLFGGLIRRMVLSRAAMAIAMRRAARQPVSLPAATYLGDERQFAAIQEIFRHAILDLPARYRDVHETLPAIAVPVTVLWGDADPFFPIAEGRRMASLIPRAAFGVLEQCGHFAPEEKPGEVSEVILRMVRSVQP